MIQQNKKPTSFFRELWERRVFQFLGVYLGAGWGVLEFTGSLLVDRFHYDPELINISFTIIASLLPSILLIAWFHGRPGPDKWHKVEKIAIPINLILTVFLVIWILPGHDLDAGTASQPTRTSAVSTTEETPAPAVRNRITLWNFQGRSDRKDADWLHFGIPQMLSYTLGQNMYNSIRTQYQYQQEIQDTQNDPRSVLPQSLIRNLTQNDNFQYFVTGTYIDSAGLYTAGIEVYEAVTYKLLKRYQTRSSSLTTLIDSLSSAIGRNTDTGNASETTEIIPTRELLSHNDPALAAFFTGRDELMTHNDHAAALRYYKEAAALDNSFSYVYFELLILYSNTNQKREANEVLGPLMEKLYKLPEQDRYFVRYYYYIYRNELDKAVALLDMWSKLFPEDVRPLYRLARNHYMNQGRYALAIQEYEKILTIEPQADELILNLGALYSQIRDFDMSRKYYNDYIRRHPDQIRGYLALADLEKDTGNFQAAKDIYDKILIMDDNNPGALTGLAEMSINHADFNQAEALIAKALNFSRSAADSLACLTLLSDKYYFRADFINALRYRILADNLSRSINSPVNILVNKINDIDMFLDMGENSVADDIIEEIRKLAPPFNEIYLLGNLDRAMYQKNKNDIELCIVCVDTSAIRNLLGNRADVEILRAKAVLAEMDGHYNDAVKDYDEAMQLLPESRLQCIIPKARCLRLAGNYEDAAAALNEMLVLIPAQPEMHYELAQVRWAQGERQDAINHLSIALQVWQDAHPRYQKARDAQGLMRRWKILM